MFALHWDGGGLRMLLVIDGLLERAVSASGWIELDLPDGQLS